MQVSEVTLEIGSNKWSRLFIGQPSIEDIEVALRKDREAAANLSCASSVSGLRTVADAADKQAHDLFDLAENLLNRTTHLTFREVSVLEVQQ